MAQAHPVRRGGRQFRLNDLTAGLLDGTLSISGRPLAKPTVHSYVRAINTFLAWAPQEGEAVTARAQRPRLDRRLLDVLSRDEILAMEEHAGNERETDRADHRGHRDPAR